MKMFRAVLFAFGYAGFAFATKIRSAEPAEPAPTTQPETAKASQPLQIPFNKQNKETAKKIYQLTREIQESEFRPETNLGAIAKLQETVSQTDFSTLAAAADYIRDSLTLNTLRSKDIKTQQANTGKSANQNESQSGINGGINPSIISLGGDRRQSTAQKHEDETSSGLSISSQNDGAVLDRARQQQATAYGKFLSELKRAGFPRPVDAKLLLGKWNWRCNEDAATYEFEFKPDGGVLVRLKADNPSLWVGHGFVNKGKGEWILDYRSLSLKLNDANLARFGKQFPLIFFDGKEISMVNDEKMILACDEDNELKKIKDDPKKHSRSSVHSEM